jgi:hypothetical protein
MTRTLALAAALMLVPTAALPGLKRDCKLAAPRSSPPSATASPPARPGSAAARPPPDPARFEKDAGGTARLTMTVRGTSELKNWILAQGPFVEVLAPASLRSQIGDPARETAARYALTSVPAPSP